MKKIIFLEGKAFIANEISVNSEADNCGHHLTVNAAIVHQIFLAVQSRMQHCIEEFGKAIEENRIAQAWYQHTAPTKRSYGWVDPASHTYQHFSEAAYEAMESVAEKLSAIYEKFGKGEFDTEEYFQDVFEMETFSLQEIEQISKAICDWSAVKCEIKFAFTEMLIMKAVEYGKVNC